MQRGAPADVAVDLASDAALVVCDRGYLRHQRQWRDQLVADVDVPVVQVESDVVVPVELASDKREHAARTIRPKITKHLGRFLVPLKATTLKNTTAPDVEGEDVSDPAAYLGRLDVDASVPPVPLFTGGATAAQKTLDGFLRDKFAGVLPTTATSRRPTTCRT